MKEEELQALMSEIVDVVQPNQIELERINKILSKHNLEAVLNTELDPFFGHYGVWPIKDSK
jgi:hypothetical protein|tara:strand:- start:692 stop:874 length:183 start_codon:yes stop_codon:yes gene_type:complete